MRISLLMLANRKWIKIFSLQMMTNTLIDLLRLISLNLNLDILTNLNNKQMAAINNRFKNKNK